MRNHLWRSAIGSGLLFLLASLPVSAQNLTGAWQCNDGGTYSLRQLGSDLWWFGEYRPYFANVFHGVIEGRRIRGQWADVPRGQTTGAGDLVIRIESADHLVMESSSGNFSGTDCQRAGSSQPQPQPQPRPQPGGGFRGGAQANWGTNAVSHRGENGQRFSYSCPPGGAPGNVWGTDVYTDDSSICTAAVHAGLITLANGGTVTIEMRPGQSSYAASRRNGVGSSSYGEWSGSYVFAGAEGPVTDGPGWRSPSGGRGAPGTFSLVESATEVSNNQGSHLTIDPAAGTAYWNNCCDGARWKIQYRFEVPRTITPGRVARITTALRFISVEPDQPLGLDITARAPDFAKQLIVNYPSRVSDSVTYEYVPLESTRDMKDFFIIINFASSEVRYHYRPN
jgi:hypothetical protein